MSAGRSARVTETGSQACAGLLGSLDRPSPDGETAVFDSALHVLLDELATSLLEGIRLAKRVMLLTELGDAAERRANMAVESATGDAPDDIAIERAVSASAALTEVNEQEAQASGRWAVHIERAAELAGQAQSAVRALEAAEEEWCRSEQSMRGSIQDDACL